MSDVGIGPEIQVHVDKQFPVGTLKCHGKSALGMDNFEIEANRFSAALLIPRDVLEQAFAVAARSLDIDDDSPIEELARRLRVSKQAQIRNL